MNITVEYFRYQLVPDTTIQLSLFEKTYTIEELKSKKNDFFADIINNPQMLSNRGFLPCRKLYGENNLYYLQLSNKQKKKVTKDFTTHSIDDEPFVMVFINNDPSEQIIAISRNRAAYQSTDSVVKILKDNIQKKLHEYRLSIYIEPIFNEVEFWELTKTNKIKWLKFVFIKPNLANISRTYIGESRNLADNLNSHKTENKYISPKNDYLENLNEENETLAGMVSYAANGGGDIIVKDEDRPAKKLSEKVKIKTFNVEVEIENPSEDTIKMLLDKVLKDV